MSVAVVDAIKLACSKYKPKDGLSVIEELVQANVALVEELRTDVEPPYTGSVLDAWVAFGGECALTATLLCYHKQPYSMDDVATLLCSEGYSEPQVRLSLIVAVSLVGG